jgi:hypothetical protein
MNSKKLPTTIEGKGNYLGALANQLQLQQKMDSDQKVFLLQNLSHFQELQM